VNAVALARTAASSPAARMARSPCGSRLAAPEQVLEGHVAPIVSLAVSPDGATLASASWDRTIRLWPLKGGEPRVLEDHQQNVNGVAFTPDGKALVSAAYDLTLRIWPLDGSAPTALTLPTPLNSVAIARDGEIVAGRRRRPRVFLLVLRRAARRDRQRPDADRHRRRIGRRRARGRGRHPRLGRDHRPP
jgi:cytochrome c